MTDTNALATIAPEDSALAAEAATTGDLKNLSPEKRAALYGAICRSIGVNPLTQPFSYIILNGKLTLYANRSCADQLRKINGVVIDKVDRAIEDGQCIVTVSGYDRYGRQDMEIGVVPVKGLTGDAYGNAIMKAITKAKRRLTLSLCGLGWLDETEVSAISNARFVQVDQTTGEIVDPNALAPTVELDESDRTVPEDSPEVEQTKLAIWKLAWQFKWDQEALNDACVEITGVNLNELSPSGFTDLHNALITADDAVKAKYRGDADASGNQEALPN